MIPTILGATAVAFIVFIIFLLVFAFLLARFSWPLKYWLIGLLILFVAFQITDIFPTVFNIILLSILAIFSLLGLYKPARRILLTSPVYRLMKNTLPPISQTEQEAIESGTIGWEAQLFTGSPDWSVLFNSPKSKLTDEEERFLSHEVSEYCERCNPWQTSIDKDLSQEQWAYLKENRFLGLVIPKSYGGLGFSEDAHAKIITKIATRCAISAVSVMVPNSLGPAKLLLHYGTKSQRDHYLPRLAKGEEIPCFALTGPSAGSDASSIPDTGILCMQSFQGVETLGFKVTLDKRYITLAPIATLVGLAFKAFDPEHLLGEQFNQKIDLGITCVLLPADTEGLEIGNRLNPLNNHFHNGTIRGKDIFIPVEWVIGGVDNIGKGWKMLMECLSIGRGISLPALSNASGQKTTLVTGAYGRVRKQFNLPIAKFEGVAEQLAEIAKYSYIMDGACKLITSSLTNDEKPVVMSAMVKYYNTESCRKVINISMDIHAGKGIIAGPSNYLMENYMSIPVAITVEGANILTRSLMIFGQGALRCHPFLQKEMQALADSKDGLEQMDQILIQHISYTIKNKARSFIYGLSSRLFAPKSNQPIAKELEPYIKKVNQISAALAFLSDISFLTIGGALKRKETLTGHFSDVWMSITMLSGVLKKYQDEGAHREDFPLVQLACNDLLENANRVLHKILDNYPIKIFGKLLKIVVTPWGSNHRAASDKLRLEVAELLTSDTSTLRRLTPNVFISKDNHDTIKHLLNVRAQMSELEQIEKKIKQSNHLYRLWENNETWLLNLVKDNVLTQNEVDTYRQLQRDIRKVIDVDEFDPKLY